MLLTSFFLFISLHALPDAACLTCIFLIDKSINQSINQYNQPMLMIYFGYMYVLLTCPVNLTCPMNWTHLTCGHMGLCDSLLQTCAHRWANHYFLETRKVILPNGMCLTMDSELQFETINKTRPCLLGRSDFNYFLCVNSQNLNVVLSCVLSCLVMSGFLSFI